MTYKILCCDGGGIRGLITALLIQNLNKTCDGFLDRANGFAGTSTGGLIALGLARGVGIDQIVTLYKTKGREIFTPNGWFGAKPVIEELYDDAVLTAGPGKTACQYKSDGLKEVVEDLLGADRLSDSKKFIAVNAAQLWDSRSHSWQPCTMSGHSGNPFRDVSMVDAALATSAAPTYFPPHEVSGQLGYFADGGVFANNPATTAVAEVLGRGIVTNSGDIRVLSLGTGHVPQGIPPSVFERYRPLSWGASKWLWPAEWAGHVPGMALISLMFATSAGDTTTVAEQLLGPHFRRANVTLDKPYELDNYKDIKVLEKKTSAYMKSPAWKDVCDWVKENWV